MNVRGVGERSVALLDVDGTLVLSNDQHARAWTDALAEGGTPVPYENVRRLVGMGGDMLLPALGVGLTADAEPGKTIMKRRGEIFKERYLHEVRPSNGARHLLESLRRHGVRRIVATSAKPEELQAVLRLCSLDDAIDDAATSEDAEQSKPAADILVAAFAKTGTKPADCVMVGDTKFDVIAARDAGVVSIALRCGGTPDADLRDAARVFDDPEALANEIDAADGREALAS